MDGGHGPRQPMSPAISASAVVPQQRQMQLHHHPARAAIADLFTLYLGMNSKQRAADPSRESSNKLQKRVTALNRDQPRPDEQFISDYEQLRMQFPDQEQLQAVTESVLISFVLQCSSHAPQSEFLLFATRCLCARGHLGWDSLLPSLLNTVSSMEAPMGQGVPFLENIPDDEALVSIIMEIHRRRDMVETTRKIISFHKDDKSLEANNIGPQSILLDFISSSQTLRIWSFNTSIREHLNSDQLQKGKQIDEWWKQMTKASGERMIDFMNLDERATGMFWVLSFTMAQPACEAVMNWFTSAGMQDLIQGPNMQPNERIMMMRETYPLSMSLLSGLSINLCLKLAFQLEETIFLGQAVPSIAMVETYVRLLLITPHSLFRPHFTTLTQRSPSILSKSGVSLLLLEILNYRLLPLYRYHGKSKALMYDVTKIISMIKGKRGEHRLFRLAENLCMNLILSLKDFFFVKKELKGPTEFTETLNRITIISLAITIKTRGIAEVEHMIYLQPLLEQIMATSQHTWSEKTLRHFPPLIRDFLMGRMDKRGQAIQTWQQAETTVINQCNQLLSPSAEPNYVMTYLSHSFPQHRQYLCAGAWMLMNGHIEINSANLARVLRELSPEEVTANIYTMVDVLLHHIQFEVQRGHLAQDLLSKAITNLSFFIWTHELLPLDILLLALIDRDDDPYALRLVISLLEKPELQQRVKAFCSSRSSEHWLKNQHPKRVELQKALGNHLSWKDRYPPFFDDIAARLLPVIPLIIYRLIENDATDIADRVLAFYSSLLAFHPLRFTFVRDILAYFYGYLPIKLIGRILNLLGVSTKVNLSALLVGAFIPIAC
nr:unnamed protein product [Digitaria exilis]